ncbi:MAG: cytochrome c [Acidobacteria bacterium]|nr:cytochrome c [Acidobacteriota bacterium]
MRSLNGSIGLLLAFAVLGSAQSPNPAPAAKVEYGRYLSEEVAKCTGCHTPNDEKGALDRAKLMKGKVMEYAPIEPIKDWHKTSPDITPSGRLWTRWGGEKALVKYLTTGLTPKGTLAGPPMPTYKMSQQDAEAIVEYLKTLK